MTSILRRYWYEMHSSFWFVPAALVVAAVAGAIGLVQMDTILQRDGAPQQSLLFGAGADGSRGLLTAVASSMITVAGVVFSITIVALSLTSSQYTSRVLRNFMRDRTNQIVLGVFVGIFAYCLVVLRSIRGGDEGAFVPSLAVLGGLLLAFVGIAFLIYFIHHISVSIQASSILATAAEETIAAVDHLFPQELGEDTDGEAATADLAASLEQHQWLAVGAQATGYVESVDSEALLDVARRNGCVVRMERGVGEFVVQGTPLVSVAGPDPPADEMSAELNAVYAIGRQRSMRQDAGFGIRQIVDVALKALSPGVNDTTTAVMCVDYLVAILVRLATRNIAAPGRMDQGELRVIACGASFESMLGESFDQIRQNAEGNPAVLTRLLEAIEIIASQTVSARRKQALRRQANGIAAVARRTILSPTDRAGIEAALERLSGAIGS